MENMELMYEDMVRMLKKLKKASFEKNSTEFAERYGHYFHEMTENVAQAENKDKAAQEIGEQLTGDLRRTYSNKRGKINSGDQANLNLFTIFYVFPTLLKTGSEDAQLIADAICNAWAKEFKGNNIQYTDYDTLYQSFRNKIFGIL